MTEHRYALPDNRTLIRCDHQGSLVTHLSLVMECQIGMGGCGCIWDLAMNTQPFAPHYRIEYVPPRVEESNV